MPNRLVPVWFQPVTHSLLFSLFALLRFLAEVTKTKVRRQNVEQPDDPELEARMSQMTNTWWCA